MTDTRPATIGDLDRLEDQLGARISAVEARVTNNRTDIEDLKTKQAVTSLKYVALSAIGASIPFLITVILYITFRGK